MKFKKFIPFYKIDAVKREVTGIVTAELPDKMGEVCDYATTKPYYLALAGEMGKATDGENICPLREMHQLSAVGKGISMNPDDGSKEIRMTFKVVDDAAWNKVVEKVYTGFSHGGDYVQKWDKDGYVYYTADPSEVSLVDNPCLGAARFVAKADGTLELQKIGGATEVVAAGSDEKGELANLVKMTNRLAVSVNGKAPEAEPWKATELERAVRKLLIEAGLIKEAKTKRVSNEDLPASAFAYVGDAEKTDTWHLPIKFSTEEKTKRHIRNALSRFDQTEGIPAEEKPKVKAKIVAAAKKHGIEVTEESKKAVRAAVVKMLPGFAANTKLAAMPAEELAKGMYQVGNLARMLDDFAWLVASTQWEKDYENDDSTVPDDLREVLTNLIPVFLSMAEEEASELLASTAKKAALGGSMLKIFERLVAALRKLTAEDLKKVDLGVTPDDLEKAGKSCHECLDSMHKAVTDHHDAMEEVHKAHAEKCIKLHKAHMEAMHGHIEKIRKALGAGDTSDHPVSGTEKEGTAGTKAMEAELQKAKDAQAAAEAKLAEIQKKIADGATGDEANKALLAGIDDLKKTLKAQEDALKAQADELKAVKEKAEKASNTLLPHGPEVPMPFLISRDGAGSAPVAKAAGAETGGL